MITKTKKLKDYKIFTPHIFNDERGSFIKIYSKNSLPKEINSFDCQESFYTISKKNVIRGMHFQIPPLDHSKIIYVIKGTVLDIILDIRKNSSTYGQFAVTHISDNNHKCIYIPKGFAHGFKVLSQIAIVNYLQTSIYSFQHDTGIRFDSFGFDWELENPIISKRDKNLPTFSDFKSPF